jgi:phage shock protein PspC (stress-responsive transcriptional regulator)
MPSRLYRSRRNRIIAGVCGGIAERLSLSPWLVRGAFLIGSLLPVVPGAVVYLILWIALPSAEQRRRTA